MVVDFGCCYSYFVGVVDSLLEFSLHFRPALVETAADYDRVSVILLLVHLKLFLRLSDDQDLFVFEVFATPSDV